MLGGRQHGSQIANLAIRAPHRQNAGPQDIDVPLGELGLQPLDQFQRRIIGIEGAKQQLHPIVRIVQLAERDEIRVGMGIHAAHRFENW